MTKAQFIVTCDIQDLPPSPLAHKGLDPIEMMIYGYLLGINNPELIVDLTQTYQDLDLMSESTVMRILCDMEKNKLISLTISGEGDW